ncbi:MAG: hypothetical protein JW797_19150 [Bradymonadales bacterium]|nr:hypothetical protein [Bradymonadales bacterium]
MDHLDIVWPLLRPVVLLWLGGVLLLGGCGELFGDLLEPRVTTADLSGEWTLRGEGVRDRCTDRLYEGEFSLRLASRLSVRQTGTDRQGLALLELAQEVKLDAVRLVMSGGVQGNRVEFSLREEVEGVAEVDFQFVGAYNPARATIEGEFSGEGPMGCKNGGRFTVTVEKSGQTGADY